MAINVPCVDGENQINASRCSPAVTVHAQLSLQFKPEPLSAVAFLYIFSKTNNCSWYSSTFAAPPPHPPHRTHEEDAPNEECLDIQHTGSFNIESSKEKKKNMLGMLQSLFVHDRQ